MRRNAAKKPSTIAVVRGMGPRFVSAKTSRNATVRTSETPRSPLTFQCTFSKVTLKSVARSSPPASRELVTARGTATETVVILAPAPAKPVHPLFYGLRRAYARYSRQALQELGEL